MALHTFQNFLDQNNLDFKILEADSSTHTAAQAAEAFGVPVSNIVKSLLVGTDKGFFLVLTPGDKRLDFDFLKEKLHLDIVSMASADEVKKITGYSIGGVPPFAHSSKIKTYIFPGFKKDDMLVAAAGSGNSVFKITFAKLKEITGGVDL